ncbi:hypothetical protein AKJ43_01490 [candidate division MSBL1 archaeon SCGC-AAA261D19]|uniref:Mevalonate kinase n=1 Tax=candidate division MSBL1 archaeon SCGC-AAA261D19 TaxID=1698273 RepID=A0A133V827_9EURY|nr:hypothetical protein AKJ43_01490 [candidate division MSBL1 archaeon SCGC-AAA261D19]
MASAPGQIFLFGEHAVVYGQMALATTIGKYTGVRGKVRSDKRFKVSSKGVGKLSGKVGKLGDRWLIRSKTGDVEKLNYVTKATELTFDYIGKGKGLTLQIESDFPISSGLGSSSAVTVATIAAASKSLGETLSKEEVSELAFDTEMAVQGAASKTGVMAATYGNFIKVVGDRVEHVQNFPRLSILIGYTGVYARTPELIKVVKELKGSHPEIFELALEVIGEITRLGATALKQRDFKKAGTFMNINQTFLELLGASSPELRRLISAALQAGALGAKLTGAGGGGSMIAFSPGNSSKVAKAIEEKNGQAIIAKIGVEGLRVSD